MNGVMRAWDVVLEVAEQLALAQVTSPMADARWLVCHALDCDGAALVLHSVDDGRRSAIDTLVARRMAGEPVQHITGTAAFRYGEVAVGPGVFIPRPETELLVDLVLDELSSRPEGQRVVELCAGSGAITRSLATERGGLLLHAVERSEAAWPWLQRNLAGLDVDIRLGDMAEAFHDLDGRVDVVVVNPPYVPEGLKDSLPREIASDPEEAVFSGPDGLDAIRVVRRVALRLLRPGGLLALEHDESHGEAMATLFAPPQFESPRVVTDLAGRPRHCLTRRGRMGG